uniref:RNA/RNP complex-1-interacting phosphatase n=1 Tax=Catharus ustulatus TaxID=91951 RepID=A0A8C3UQN1_CATUS
GSRAGGVAFFCGWTDYIPLGHRMPGTRFIAFKVPLKENLLPEDRFSPHDLIREVEERKEELGLIIDLTCTTRYYGREELPPTLRYVKILTMGHKIPNRKTISRFKHFVKRFLTANKDNDKLIGVHCTHGLNRTGYLVCRYLIDVEGMEPNAAIELFNKCRGHPIERMNYIQDLQKRVRVRWDPGEKSLPVREVKGWDGIPRKSGASPSLEVSKVRLEQPGIGEVSLPMVGMGLDGILGPFQPKPCWDWNHMEKHEASFPGCARADVIILFFL